jgi:hypothetical protein
MSFFRSVGLALSFSCPAFDNPVGSWFVGFIDCLDTEMVASFGPWARTLQGIFRGVWLKEPSSRTGCK